MVHAVTTPVVNVKTISNFAFDETTHTYRLDGKVLPSVTTILKPLYDFSAVPRDILERARRFGNAVHKTIELYLNDDLDEDTLDEPLYNCLLAFKLWQSDFYEYEITPSDNIEQIGYHQKLLYCGTPDIETKTVIIDLKSRKCNPEIDGMQILAYDHMTGTGQRDNYVLELKQDASYVFTPLNATAKQRKENWSKFRYLLEYHNMGEEIKRWETK